MSLNKDLSLLEVLTVVSEGLDAMRYVVDSIKDQLSDDTKLSPDWQDAPSWANWFAVDGSADGFFYACEPYISADGQEWTVDEGTDMAYADYNYGYTERDFHKSLQQRPLDL